MRTVDVGGISASAIGLGCWQFGAREWGYGDDYAEREAVAIVRRALELGVNLLDTAEVYGFGRSERIVGRAIADRRDAAFVATKFSPVVPFGPIVARQAAASRRRLGIDAIDLYQAHRPNPVVPERVTMAAMQELQRHGTVRHVGVSNYSLARWQAAERALEGPVVSNQVQYSLLHRRPERDLLPWARANDRLVIAYRPLEQGVLGGRYGPANRPKRMGIRAINVHFLPENLRRSQGLLDGLRRVAADHEATPAQVALAWLLRQDNVVAIPGASSVAQLEHNVAAADLDLTADDVAELTERSDAYHPVGPTALAHRLLPGQPRST